MQPCQANVENIFNIHLHHLTTVVTEAPYLDFHRAYSSLHSVSIIPARSECGTAPCTLEGGRRRLGGGGASMGRVLAWWDSSSGCSPWPQLPTIYPSGRKRRSITQTTRDPGRSAKAGRDRQAAPMRPEVGVYF